jgi:hypothetical protein
MASSAKRCDSRRPGARAGVPSERYGRRHQPCRGRERAGGHFRGQDGEWLGHLTDRSCCAIIVTHSGNALTLTMHGHMAQYHIS